MPKSKAKAAKPKKKTQQPKKSQEPKIRAAKTKAAKTTKPVGQKKSPKAKAQAVSLKVSAPVFDITGRRLGQVSLPQEIFGQRINENLMSQAIRVYFANRNLRTASAKTRSQVRGGGRKPWRQKGTGKARAGSIRSPLWVGGGIVFGPKYTGKKLNLSKKMKRAALASALSQKAKGGEILVVSNFEKMEPKTKTAAGLLQKLKIGGKTLIVLEQNKKDVRLAMRNIPDVDVNLADSINAYEVLSHKNLMFEKLAIAKFK